MKNLMKCCFGLAVALNAGAAHAASISGTDIIPSTTLPPQTIGNFTFTIDQIADGITSNLNGFASTAATGTITLDLVGEFNLNSFILWNDVNVLAEGIENFQLKFFNSSNDLTESSNTLVGPLGQFEGEEYVFDEVVRNVSRVDLVVLSSYPGFGSDIEIREVAFTGTPVPEPLTILGSATALGIGGLLKREHSKKKNKS
jgi:hypothetical protein